MVAFCLSANAQVNDNFENRIPISGTNLLISFDNTLATRQSGEPVHPPPAAGHTLWWSWQAPENGWLVLNSESIVYTSEAVYKGTNLNGLALARRVFPASDVWIVKSNQIYSIVRAPQQTNMVSPSAQRSSAFRFCPRLPTTCSRAPKSRRCPQESRRILPALHRKPESRSSVPIQREVPFGGRGRHRPKDGSKSEPGIIGHCLAFSLAMM